MSHRASTQHAAKMQRFVLPALLCSTAAALLAPATPSRRTVRRHGFFDDMMDKFVVADTDESKQSPPPEPEKDERDAAEKLFGFFFGEVEDAPMGLTRMNVTRSPTNTPRKRLEIGTSRSLATTPISSLGKAGTPANDARAPPNVRGLRLEPGRLDAAGFS